MRDQQRLTERHEFFTRLLETLHKQAPRHFHIADNAIHDAWLCIARYPEGADSVGSLNYSFSPASKIYGRPPSFRVEFHIDAWGKDGNKKVRDLLHAHRDELPQGIGNQIEWDNTDTRGAAQRLAIYYKRPGPILNTSVNDPALIPWGVDTMIRLFEGLDGIWSQLDFS